MDTEEIDDLQSQAPPAKRLRLEASEEMEVNMIESEIPDAPAEGDERIEENIQPRVEVVVSTVLEKAENEGLAVLSSESPSQEINTKLETAVSTSGAPFQDSSTDSDIKPASPKLTHGLEALLGGLDPEGEKLPVGPSVSLAVPDASGVVESNVENEGNIPAPARDGQEVEDDHPEWEVDSSPIESSSDDSSSDDSSSDESEDGDNAYKMLSLEEQARILMEGDGVSDDEGGDKKAKGVGGQLRTKNEVPEEVIPKPDVTITPEMPIELLGTVEGIIENVLLIKAKTSGEYRVLDTESVLCLEDRSVIGVVSETIGRVQQPLYSVRFTNAAEIAEAGLSLGTKVFYSEQHSKYVFTQALKAFKGSDASNLHDEEVGDEEMEFSDDEAEAEHKRKIKQKRFGKGGGKGQQNREARRGPDHPLQQQQSPGRINEGINYDDPEDEGPYKPLARPVGYADTVGRGEAPQEGYLNCPSSGGQGGYGQKQSRDQFGGRGRGDRGRGRGDRSRGRGGYEDRRGGGSGYSLAPQGHPNGGYTPAPQNPSGFQTPYQNQQLGFPSAPTSPLANYYNNQMHQQYSPLQPMMPNWHQHPPAPQFPTQPYQQPFPNAANAWQNMGTQPPLASGAFLNPAFFGAAQPANPNQWSQQEQRGGGGANGGTPR